MRFAQRQVGILSGTIAVLLAGTLPTRAQTYTSASGLDFTNPLAWNFGAGPLPVSDAALTLNLLNYTSGLTATDDLNLTLNTLNLSAYGSLTVNSLLGGDFAFAGAAQINVLGSAASVTLSAPVVLGSSASGLTFDGAGASGVSVSGVISSNTSTGAPLIIATDARNSGAGVVSLSAVNTFAGGVVLNTGTLSLGNVRALGDRQNVLTINGGYLRSSASQTVANNVALAGTLNFNSTVTLGLSGALTGLGGVTVRPGSASSTLVLSGVDTYSGATTIGASTFAAAAVDGAGALTILGAGSILTTSSIGISGGGVLSLNYVSASALNTRVSTSTAITSHSGFVQVIGGTGVVKQNFGTVNAGGLTTLAALTNAAGAGTAGAATEVTIANLARTAGATVLFQGQNLGGIAVAPGLAAAQGNVLLTTINGTTATAALVGGAGAAGSTTLSILPWAVGDTANSGLLYAGGAGFVTLGANGVRLLNTSTEYKTTNNFTTVGATENVRVTGAITSHTAPATVNALFFASSGQALAGGANALTITSGALASNVAAATISNLVNFGTAGAGEAIVSVVDALAGTANNLTLSGGFKAASLVKSGHGDLTISTTNPTISGAITINGGEVIVDAVSRLGGATNIVINGQSQAAQRAGLSFTYTSGTQTLATPIVTTGGAATITTANGGTLVLNSSISGSGGVNYNAASLGLIQIGGPNTYTGPTFLSGAGVVAFTSDAAFGSSADPAGGFLWIGGTTLQVNGAWTSARHIAIPFPTEIDTGTNPVTLSGPISGFGALTKSGSSTLLITGNDSSYSGTITLGLSSAAGGTLALSGVGALNSASVTFGGAGGGSAGTYVLDLSGAADIDPSDGNPTPWRSLASLVTTGGFGQTHTVQLGSTNGARVDLRVGSSGASFDFGGAAGVISGFGKLVKVGTGALTLSGSTASTFTGGVEVWGGTLTFIADSQLGNSANGVTIRGGVFNYSGAGLVFNRAITLGATPQPILSGSGSVQVLANGISASGPFNVNATISGAGGFEKSGFTTLTLGTANAYLGDTQITLGTLAFSNPNQLGDSTSRIRLNGGKLSDAASSGTQTLARTVIITANSTVDVISTATLDLAGPIVGTNTITKTSTGALNISGNNSSFFGKLTIGNGSSAGLVTLGSSGQLRRAGVTFTTLSGSAFNVNGSTQELGSLTSGTGTGVVALGTGTALIVGFNNPTNPSIDRITGDVTASLTLVGTSATTFTSASNNFGGGFHVLSSSAILSGSGLLNSQAAFTIGGWGDPANTGGSLQIDNSTTNSTLRLASTQAIYSNSGAIVFTSNGITASSQTTGSLRGAGMTTVTMFTGGTLNFGDAATGLTRVDRGTFLFRSQGGNLGNGAATTALPVLTFGNLPGSDLIGGGGGAGTATISILPYAVGGSSAADTGRAFVTFGANGIRALNPAANETQASFSAAGATENVRMGNATLTTNTLAADQTINSLNIAGTASTTRIDSAAAQKLTVTSGAVLNVVSNVWTTNANSTAGLPLGVQTAELQTGAGNSAELNVFTTGGDLALGAKVSTSGGLTKSGAANLYLTNTANTYTGQTTINAGRLVIDDKLALGGSTSLVIGGGFLKYRGLDTTLTGFTVKAAGGAAAGLGASAGFHVVSGTTLTLPAASVSGNGGILKDGTGVLKLTGTNSNSGATIIDGGALAIDNPAALGANGRVIFGTGLSTSGGQTLRFDAPMTLTQDFITNTSDAGIGIGFDTNGNNVTLSGTILDARSTSIRGLYKFGAGELNLTATEMYTGATQVFGGTLRLSGANGSILNSTGAGGYSNAATVLVNPGAALVLDNAAANNNNRLPDVWDTPFGTGNAANGAVLLNGGDFKIIGNAGGTSERINQITATLSTITLSGGGTTLTSGNAGLSFSLIRGTNLGGTPGAGSTNWFVTDLGAGGVTLGGAGGEKDTPFVNIVRGTAGDTSDTGLGTDLLTYGADTGFRLLKAAEYSSTIPSNNFDLNRAPNVALTGAATVNQTTAITALKLGAGASVGGAGTLLLSQGTVLTTANAAITAPSLSTNVTGASAGYVFLTPGATTTLTLDSVLPSSSINTYGAGTVALNGRYIGTGSITIGQGTFKMNSAAAALNPLGSQVGVLPGATFDLGGSDRVISNLTGTTGLGTFQMGQRFNGTVALGANRLTIYDSPPFTFTGDITGSGGVTKAYFSSGITIFGQPQSYTGSTVIRGGTLRLGGSGTLASTAVEIRGGTLQFNNTDDNAAASGYVANRVGTGVPITLAGGGITFTENANTPGNHNLGTVTLAGGGFLTVTNGTTASSTVTMANLSRTAAHGTLTVSATNLGLTQSPVGNARVFATQIEGTAPAVALIGGGGAVGSATQSILPWAWSSTAGSFLTYGADGLRPLATSEYASDLIAPGSTAANVRMSADQTLTAPQTVNSLIANNVSGTFDLTVSSGALSLNGTFVGTPANSLLTGGGNSRELVISGSLATLAYSLTTSGGVTTLSNVILAGTNPFGGGLTINGGEVQFDSDVRLGAAGGLIRFGTNGFGGLNYIGSPSVPIALDRPIETNSYGYLTAFANQQWSINQPITGPGAIAYFGTDVVYKINAPNTYSGPTRWAGGHLYIKDDASFGAGGELILTASSAQNIVLRGNWISNRLIQSLLNTAGIQTNGFDAIWNGHLIGNQGLTKNGLGNLILTEPMPYNGVLTVSAGAVVLRDRGSLAADGSTRAVLAGAALVLDDTGLHLSDRLHDSAGTLFVAGGELSLLGSGGVTTEEVTGNLSLSAATASTVTVAAGSGQAAILRVAGTLDVNAGASLWRGTNLGVNAPGAADSATVILTETNSLQQSGLAGVSFLTGGAAPAGNPSVSIIRGAFGDTSPTGLGTQLVTYDFDKGIRLLNPATEFTTTLVNGSVVTDNVKADASSIALPNATTANALWLSNAASVTGAGTMTLTAGSLLVTGTGNTIANPITAGSNALAIGGPGDVTLNGTITGTGGLIKMGAGTLTLGTANSYTGPTVLAAGTVAVGNASAFGTTAVQFQGAAIQNATAAPLTLTNNLTLNGPMFVSGTQALTFSGTVTLNNATREINVTSTGTTTLSGVISSSQTLINYGLTKTGPGLLVLSNANTYDGETTVNGGELRITGSIAASTLTTVTSGTLSGTGTVGALKTTGGTLAPGAAGVGTLKSGDTTFAGGTFALELASAASADKLNVTGTVSLNANTALTLALLGGYVPAPGDSWTIIDNDGTDPVSLGSFRFTSAGNPIQPLTPFTLGATQYVLNYAGGTGNDLVLQAVPEPITAALLLGGALGLVGFTRRRENRCR